jgi:hypothetical protein
MRGCSAGPLPVPLDCRSCLVARRRCPLITTLSIPNKLKENFKIDAASIWTALCGTAQYRSLLAAAFLPQSFYVQRPSPAAMPPAVR